MCMTMSQMLQAVTCKIVSDCAAAYPLQLAPLRWPGLHKSSHNCKLTQLREACSL